MVPAFVGVQCLGILVEVEGAKFGRRVAALLPSLLVILESHEAENTDEVVDDGDHEDSSIPGWQVSCGIGFHGGLGSGF